MDKQEVIYLTGKDTTIEDIVKISRFGYRAAISDEVREIAANSRKVIDDIVAKEIGTYGINTGFGRLSTVSISKENIEELQKNLIMSHATGVGKPLTTEAVRAMMALRINALVKGFSGISLDTLLTLMEMLNKRVHPIVPERGSVGASGDLCPLAHMVLPMIGEGEAEYEGEILPGAVAMEKAGIPTIKLKAKEGLALINGTCAMMAAGVLATYDAKVLMKSADIIASMTMEALEGVIDAFDERIQMARPHKGQIDCAKNIRELCKGSGLVTRQGEKRIQDAYSLRCIPAIHGASREAFDYVWKTVSTEINAATDNPLIFSDDEGNGIALSGCNFHGQPIAIAMDTLGICVAEMANVSERRTERLVNPALNNGLPAFLTENTGLNSGLMQAQFPAAATVSENKVLAHPASVDSIPTSGNQEDHVSMGTIAARKAVTIVDYAMDVLGIELLCATQGVEFRDTEKMSRIHNGILAWVRKDVAFIKEDVVLYRYIDKCIDFVKSGALLDFVEERMEIV